MPLWNAPRILHIRKYTNFVCLKKRRRNFSSCLLISYIAIQHFLHFIVRSSQMWEREMLHVVYKADRKKESLVNFRNLIKFSFRKPALIFYVLNFSARRIFAIFCEAVRSVTLTCTRWTCQLDNQKSNPDHVWVFERPPSKWQLIRQTFVDLFHDNFRPFSRLIASNAARTIEASHCCPQTHVRRVAGGRRWRVFWAFFFSWS